jgi:hypothetical protein
MLYLNVVLIPSFYHQAFALLLEFNYTNATSISSYMSNGLYMYIFLKVGFIYFWIYQHFCLGVEGVKIE